MKAVLIIAHGSREPDTQKTLDAVVELVRAKLPETLIVSSYMEFCNATIEKGLDALVARGADDIRVVPYFLFSGIHIQEDIPAVLEEYRQAHPTLKLVMGGTLGADERLADVLADRIRETL